MEIGKHPKVFLKFPTKSHCFYGRKYYLRRSQPPFFIPMVELFINKTSDETNKREHIAKYIWEMEEEFNFWWTNRTYRGHAADGGTYTLARLVTIIY